MKSFFAVIVFLIVGGTIGYAQTPQVNDYKYVIVPISYQWAKEIDKYQINSLTTFLFKKYGFDAYTLGETLPADLNKNSCNTLTADVEEDSNFVRTKLKVTLKDCDGEVIFVSQQGDSKSKDFKKAYHEALRDAFLSIAELEYTYTGPKKSKTKKIDKQLQESQPIAQIKTKPTAIAVQAVKESAIQEVSNRPEAGQSPLVEGKDHYVSLDGTYSLFVSVHAMVFYEGGEIIGAVTPGAGSIYQIRTSEFEGKGYFENDQFIIEREIKGVQGIIKMIFEKE